MFGDCLKKARALKGVSQASLAKMINVSQQTVGSWEVNRTGPSPETISQIASVLGVSTEYLLGNTNNPEPTNKTFTVADLRNMPEFNNGYFRLAREAEEAGLSERDLNYLYGFIELHKRRVAEAEAKDKR